VIDSPLPAENDPPRSYRIPISRVGMAWLTANQRLHFHAKGRVVRQWRDATAWQCRGMGLSFPGGARIIAELRFLGVRKRDPNNWADTAKAVVDGLVDAGLFPDDDPRYVIGPDMRLGAPVLALADEELIVHIFPRQEIQQ
jgi:crossover junction endodeoxyribonuclease RusA